MTSTLVAPIEGLSDETERALAQLSAESKRRLGQRLLDEAIGAVQTPRGARFVFNPPPTEIARENCRRMLESLTPEERAEMKRASDDPDSGYTMDEILNVLPVEFEAALEKK